MLKFNQISSQQKGNRSKSIFAQKFNANQKLNISSQNDSQNIKHDKTLPVASAIVQDAKLSNEIHAENLNILSQMREEEILAERQKLLSSLGKYE